MLEEDLDKNHLRGKSYVKETEAGYKSFLGKVNVFEYTATWCWTIESIWVCCGLMRGCIVAQTITCNKIYCTCVKPVWVATFLRNCMFWVIFEPLVLCLCSISCINIYPHNLVLSMCWIVLIAWLIYLLRTKSWVSASKILKICNLHIFLWCDGM